jgi:hypothetical protein
MTCVLPVLLTGLGRIPPQPAKGETDSGPAASALRSPRVPVVAGPGARQRARYAHRFSPQ